MKQQRKKYLVLHASAGNGHTACAQAIVDMLLTQGVSKDSIVIEDFADLNGSARFIGKDFYKHCMRFPRLLHWLYMLTDIAIFPTVLSWLIKPAEKPFEELLEREQPDFVISTFPMTSNLCARARREGILNVPFVTVATDFFAHYMWVYPETDYYWVMNNETAKSFIDLGVEKERVIAGGIPLHRRFSQPVAGDNKELLAKLGLPTDRITLLVSSWVAKPSYLIKLLSSLNPLADKVACIVVCGHNTRTRELLEQQQFAFPVSILGFVDYMPDLMQVSDLLVGKAGGLTVTESLVKGLPLAIIQPLFGQEQLNADYLQECDAAFFIHKPEDIAAIVQQIAHDPVVLARKKEAIAALAVPNSTYNFVRFVLSEAGDSVRSRIGQPVIAKNK